MPVNWITRYTVEELGGEYLFEDTEAAVREFARNEAALQHALWDIITDYEYYGFLPENRYALTDFDEVDWQHVLTEVHRWYG